MHKVCNDNDDKKQNNKFFHGIVDYTNVLNLNFFDNKFYA